MKPFSILNYLVMSLLFTSCFTNYEDNFIAQNLSKSLSGGGFFDLSFSNDKELLTEKYSSINLICEVSEKADLSTAVKRVGSFQVDLLNDYSEKVFNFEKNDLKVKVLLDPIALYAEDMLVMNSENKEMNSKKVAAFEFYYEIEIFYEGFNKQAMEKIFDGNLTLRGNRKSDDFILKRIEDYNKNLIGEDQRWPSTYCQLNTKLNQKYAEDFPGES